MKTITYYLDQVAKNTETGSDYAIAKILDISTQRVSKYRGGANFDDEMCIKVADLLKIDVREVIAASNYHREKSDKKKAFWESIFEKSAVACLILGLGLIGTPSPSTAYASNGMNSIYYVKL